MEYEIVNLEEKTVKGVKARTNNNDPKMTEIIGGLWMKFFQNGIFQKIENKVNQKSIGMYYNYESDYLNEYDVMVCCEVEKEDREDDGEVITEKIPAGKYAKFIVKGHMQKAVAEFWGKLWNMNELDRSYVCDFEEYQNADENNAEIHMYISLK